MATATSHQAKDLPLAYGLDEDLKQLIVEFFEISDNPKKNSQWIECFAKDAEVDLGVDRAQGNKGKF